MVVKVSKKPAGAKVTKTAAAKVLKPAAGKPPKSAPSKPIAAKTSKPAAPKPMTKMPVKSLKIGTPKALKLNIVARKPVISKTIKKKTAISRKPDPKSLSPFIVIRNAPYGFFEEPCYNYFSQYGQVKRVRVIRNKKGGFSGKIYVGFKYAEVASVVVTVLNKSLMMGENVVKCRQLLNGEVPAAVRFGSQFGKRVIKKSAYVKKRIQKAHVKKFKENPQGVADFINKQLARAKENGIDYSFDFSKKFAAAMEEQKVRDAQNKEKIAKWLENFN
jgi:RNA recognition motif-containing protein